VSLYKRHLNEPLLAVEIKTSGLQFAFKLIDFGVNCVVGVRFVAVGSVPEILLGFWFPTSQSALVLESLGSC
jgi:hypothetical protein